jgi:hypothetical protein
VKVRERLAGQTRRSHCGRSGARLGAEEKAGWITRATNADDNATTLLSSVDVIAGAEAALQDAQSGSAASLGADVDFASPVCA